MLLEPRAVTVRFGGGTPLADVDVAFPPKGVFGLIGPNRAGKTVLLDEPTQGLEVGGVEKLGQTIQRVRGEAGGTVGLVEHGVGFVMRQCGRIVVLNLGRVIADGPAQEVGNDAAVGGAYLG